MKKNYIWQNADLNIEDWRDGYIEFCEINEIRPSTDDDLFEWMIETNAEYLEDERMNLDKTIDSDIVCIANIGRWNGRVTGYLILNNNLNSILNVQDDYMEIYGNGKDIVGKGTHHDGQNFYTFRAIRPGKNIDKFLNAVYNGEEITQAKLNYYTRSIYGDIAAIYGWRG